MVIDRCILWHGGSSSPKLYKIGCLTPFTILPLIQWLFKWFLSIRVILMGFSFLYVPEIFWTNPSISPNGPEWDWAKPKIAYIKACSINFVVLVVKFDLSLSSIVIFTFTSFGSKDCNIKLGLLFHINRVVMYIHSLTQQFILCPIYLQSRHKLIPFYRPYLRVPYILLFLILQVFHF